MNKEIKILHLENVKSDALLVNNKLKGGQLDYEIVVADTKDKFIKQLEDFSPDIILAEHTVPSFNSYDALTVVCNSGFKIPFILVTGNLPDELAVDLTNKGADDYLLKDRLSRLPAAIHNVLEKYRLKKSKRVIIDKLAGSQSLLKEAQAIAHLGSWDLDDATGVAIWTDEQLRIYGLQPEDNKQSFQTWLSYIHPDDLEYVLQKTIETKSALSNGDYFHRIIRRDGAVRYLYSQVRVKVDNTGQPTGLHGVTQDMTDRKEKENALQESQVNLQAIFENTSDGFILADINGIIKSFNTKARDRIRLNIDQEIEVGKSVYVFLPDSRKEMYKENISKVLSGEILQYDYPYTRRNGETKWFSFTINPVYNAEKIEGISITSTNITERKKAEQQLMESELFNKGILASLSSHIAVIDDNGKIIAVNKAWDEFAKANGVSSLQGVSAGSNYIEVCRRSMDSGDILAGKTLQGIQSVFNKEIKNFELEYPCHSLTEQRWFTVSAMNFGEDDSKIVISHQNITAQKIAEQERNSLQATLQSSLNEIYIFDAETLKFSYINKGALLNLGYLEQEVKVLTPLDLTDDFTEASFKILVTPLVNNEKGKIIFFANHKRKNGSLYPVEIHLQLVSEGNNKRYLAIVLDITERKSAEQIIKESEEKFHKAFQFNPDSITISSIASGKFLEVNESFTKMYGFKRAEVLGKNIVELGIINQENIRDDSISHLQTGNQERSREVVVWNKNGGEYIGLVSAELITWNNEECVMTVVRDITERKKAEQELAQSETRLRAILETEPECIKQLGLNGELLYMNPAGLAMVEADDLDMLKNKSLLNIITSAHRRAFKKLTQKVFKGESGILEFEIEGLKGTHRWLETHAVPLKNSEGKIISLLGVTRDITERKKAEKTVFKLNNELVKSEKLFKGVIESSDDMITIINPVGKTIYASPAVSKKFGYTHEECLNLNVSDIVHPEDASIMQETVVKSMMNPGVPTECPIIRDLKKDGTYMFVTGTLTNFLQTEGINAIVINFRDVTEKKKLEDLLDKSNRLAAIGSWEIDVIRGTVFWSAITKEIREADPDFIPDLNTGMQLLKEGDHRNTISKRVMECIEMGLSWDDELQIITQKGNLKWIRTIGQGEFINGKCIRVYGSFQDIDARKKIEIDVLKVYEEKNIILESIGDAFFAVDKNWVVTYWNNQAEKMLHIPKAEIIDHHLWEVLKDNIDSESYIKYHEAIETKQVIRFEDYYISLEKWYDISAYPSDNGLSVFFKDITQQKKSAVEREKITAELIQRNKDLEQFSYIVSHNMRSPVANIIGLCDVLQKNNLTAVFKSKVIAGLSSSVNRLDDVFKDLSNILKVRQEVTEIKEVVCFSKLVKNIALSIENMIDKEKATILTDFSEVDEMLTIKSYLHSIFYNLISNSLKYKKPGISPVIEITSQRLKGGIVLFFKDNGIGIDLKKRGGQVFGLYKRFHADMAEGKGMGLYMVKTQVEAIGGKISITSEINIGTEFKIVFDT